jgi:hypothetical protein
MAGRIKDIFQRPVRGPKPKTSKAVWHEPEAKTGKPA